MQANKAVVLLLSLSKLKEAEVSSKQEKGGDGYQLGEDPITLTTCALCPSCHSFVVRPNKPVSNAPSGGKNPN